MYFIDENHKDNYNHLIQLFNLRNDSDYRVLYYIYALPQIYSRCIKDPMFKEYPFAWKYEYEDISYTETDGDEIYDVIDFEVKKIENNEPMFSETYSNLSNGYKLMIQLAENLFNGSQDDFNLMSAIGSWDEGLIKAFYQALSIRLEYRRKIEGLIVTIK